MTLLNFTIIIGILFFINIWMLGAFIVMSVEDEDVGPLGKIMLKENQSQDVVIQKFLLWIIPIYPIWSIIYGIWKLVVWFKKLPPV